MDGRFALVAKLQVTGEEISVEMAEEDVANLEAKFFSASQVLLNVALWIDDYGSGTPLVFKQIGGVREATKVILFENHRSRTSLPPYLTSNQPGLGVQLVKGRGAKPSV